MANETENLNFSFHLILLNINGHMRQVTAITDGADPQDPDPATIPTVMLSAALIPPRPAKSTSRLGRGLLL